MCELERERVPALASDTMSPVPAGRQERIAARGAADHRPGCVAMHDLSGEGVAGPLAGALAPYLEPGRAAGGVLLAVSGGPDSTALLHAAAGMRAAVPVQVATVDHGLRPESAVEARGVAEAAA